MRGLEKTQVYSTHELHGMAFGKHVEAFTREDQSPHASSVHYGQCKRRVLCG